MVSKPSLSSDHVTFFPQVPDATTAAALAVIGTTDKSISTDKMTARIRFVFILIPPKIINIITLYGDLFVL